jgi:hypothetical protein
VTGLEQGHELVAQGDVVEMPEHVGEHVGAAVGARGATVGDLLVDELVDLRARGQKRRSGFGNRTSTGLVEESAWA